MAKNKKERKERKSLKKSSKILDYIFIGLIVIFFVVWFFSRPVYVKMLDVEFEVGDTLGIALSEEGLDFGQLLVGGSAVRAVELGNEFEFPVKVEVFVDKNYE